MSLSLSDVRLAPDETLCFISHHRDGAKGEARTLHTELTKILNVDPKLIFIDVDALQDLDQLLRKHVGMTRVLIFLQTRQSLFRPFVLAELYTALLDGIGVVTVEIMGGGYDFKAASEMLSAPDFAQRLEKANPGSVSALERQGIDVAQMGKVLNQRIPNLISSKFDMTWVAKLRQAGIEEIAERVIELAARVSPRKMKPAPVSEAERVSFMQRKLEELGIPIGDAAQYAPRLVREGFTSENVIALATPSALSKVGITKHAHVRALLSSEALKEMDAQEEAKVVTDERMKLEKERRALEVMKREMDSAKDAAVAAIDAANEEERRALIVRAERLHREAEEKAKKEAEKNAIAEVEPLSSRALVQDQASIKQQRAKKPSPPPFWKRLDERTVRDYIEQGGDPNVYLDCWSLHFIFQTGPCFGPFYILINVPLLLCPGWVQLLLKQEHILNRAVYDDMAAGQLNCCWTSDPSHKAIKYLIEHGSNLELVGNFAGGSKLKYLDLVQEVLKELEAPVVAAQMNRED